MSAPDLDVEQAAVVAKGHRTSAIDAIAAKAERSRDHGSAGLDLGPCGEGFGRRLPGDRPMRSDLVVVGAEPTEHFLQLADRLGLVVLGQVALLGLVEALDLAAGLGVIRPGVDVFDPQPVALELERATSTPGRGEHRPVVGEQRRRIAVGPSTCVKALAR